MFNDVMLARRSALSLSRNLMVITLVIAIGTQFAVITEEDRDANLEIVAEFDPFS